MIRGIRAGCKFRGGKLIEESRLIVGIGSKVAAGWRNVGGLQIGAQTTDKKILQ